jgi:putative intracellular protease/amidase
MTHILVVLTSHDQLGDTGKKTGFWLEELAAPYYAFVDAGAEVTLASPKGGSRLSIRKVTRRTSRPTQPAGSRPTPCQGGALEYEKAVRCLDHRFRRDLLSGWPWAALGSG